MFAAGIAAVIIWAFGMQPQQLRNKKSAKRGVSIGFALAFVSFLLYAYFLDAHVVRVETPKDGIQYRTVGSQRSADTLRDFPGQSDERLLEIAGLKDGDIERMWTPSSVRLARFELFFSYLTTLCLINFALGARARASGESDLVPSTEK